METYEEYDWQALDASKGRMMRQASRGLNHPEMSMKELHRGSSKGLWSLMLYVASTLTFQHLPDVVVCVVITVGFIGTMVCAVAVAHPYECDIRTHRARRILLEKGVAPPLKEEV